MYREHLQSFVRRIGNASTPSESFKAYIALYSDCIAFQVYKVVEDLAAIGFANPSAVRGSVTQWIASTIESWLQETTENVRLWISNVSAVQVGEEWVFRAYAVQATGSAQSSDPFAATTREETKIAMGLLVDGIWKNPYHAANGAIRAAVVEAAKDPIHHKYALRTLEAQLVSPSHSLQCRSGNIGFVQPWVAHSSERNCFEGDGPFLYWAPNLGVGEAYTVGSFLHAKGAIYGFQYCGYQQLPS